MTYPETAGEAPPDVSIVTPVYNGARFIGRTIASVVAQTFRNWEMIIVDDCSTDDIEGALADVLADPRIRLVRQPRNQGAPLARNAGIAQARGRFIAFLDSDDLWMPRKLEQQWRAVQAEQEPENVFCVTRMRVNLGGGRFILRPPRAKQPDERMDEYIIVNDGSCQTSTYFLSRQMARRILFRDLPIGEDYMFAVDCWAAGAKYLLIPDVLTEYNDEARPDRLSHAVDLTRGRIFLAAVKDAISRKSLAAYEMRFFGAQFIRENPPKGLWRLAKAYAGGALSTRYAAMLVVRAIVPAQYYLRVRTWVRGRRAAQPAGN